LTCPGGEFIRGWTQADDGQEKGTAGHELRLICPVNLASENVVCSPIGIRPSPKTPYSNTLGECHVLQQHLRGVSYYER